MTSGARSRVGDPRNTQRWKILSRQVQMALGPECYICSNTACPCGKCRRFDGEIAANTADHVQPVATHLELAFDWDNLRAAHKCCNASKGALIRRETSPREMSWHDLHARLESWADDDDQWPSQGRPGNPTTMNWLGDDWQEEVDVSPDLAEELEEAAEDDEPDNGPKWLYL